MGGRAGAAAVRLSWAMIFASPCYDDLSGHTYHTIPYITHTHILYILYIYICVCVAHSMPISGIWSFEIILGEL